MVPVTILRDTAAWKDRPSGYAAKEVRNASARDSGAAADDSGVVRRGDRYFGGFLELNRARHQRAVIRNVGKDCEETPAPGG